jgi:hypothetical protein
MALPRAVTIDYKVETLASLPGSDAATITHDKQAG